MNIKGSKIRFAFDVILGVASIAVAASLAWQIFTAELGLQAQLSHIAGVLMGIAWAVIMIMEADCHRRGLPEVD
jgi:membrane associated rhomboid family serine protease